MAAAAPNGPRHPLDVPELAAMVADFCDGPTLKSLNGVTKALHATTNRAVWARGPAFPLPAVPGPKEGIPAGVKKKLKAFAREWRETGEFTGPWYDGAENVARTRGLLLSCFAKGALRVLRLWSIPRADLIKRITKNQRGILSLEAPFYSGKIPTALDLASAFPDLVNLLSNCYGSGKTLPCFPSVRRLNDCSTLIDVGRNVPGKVMPNLEMLQVRHSPGGERTLIEEHRILPGFSATLCELSLAFDWDYWTGENDVAQLRDLCRQLLADPLFVSLRVVRHDDVADENVGTLFEKVGGEIIEGRWRRLPGDEWWEWRRV